MTFSINNQFPIIVTPEDRSGVPARVIPRSRGRVQHTTLSIRPPSVVVVFAVHNADLNPLHERNFRQIPGHDVPTRNIVRNYLGHI